MPYMHRAKSICRAVNCFKLLDAPGFCEEHEHLDRGRFKGLKRAAGSREFYKSRAWVRVSQAYREAHPLCAEHRRRGMVVKGDLVDHIVERLVLEARGDDPCDEQYLQTLCHSCHNKKLRQRGKQRRW